MKIIKPVTIKDIAKKLNLHHTTISRALHDHPRVSRATKELVIALAEELDYHPDSIAQSFRRRKSNTIGVMVPDIKNDFFAFVVGGIEETAYNSGYNITVVQSNETYAREIVNVGALVSNQVCGALVSISEETKTSDHFEIFSRRGIPLVFFDRALKNMEVSKVVVDDFAGAFRATEYLIQSGYKKIAHIAGPQNLQISKDRFNGYLSALKKHNITFDERLITYGSLNAEDGMKGCEILLQSQLFFDALFAVNDPVAVGAFVKIKEKRIKIPEDIALVGFGNNPVSSLLDPPLTTVTQSPYTMGKLAAGILISQIENRKEYPISHTEVIKSELIIRKSA